MVRMSYPISGERLVSGKVSPVAFIKLHEVKTTLLSKRFAGLSYSKYYRISNDQMVSSLFLNPMTACTQFHLTKITVNVIRFSQTNVCTGQITPIL